jgi:uncharacterized protein YbaR (Trm112 family)
MGQTIVTFCDIHMTEDGQTVAGQAYRLGIELPGEKWRWVEVDLCPSHASPLADLVTEVLDKYGRTFQPDDIHGPSLACPQCGKTFGSKSGLSGHRQRHHAAVAQPLNCPECERTFPTAQGLATHITRTHRD